MLTPRELFTQLSDIYGFCPEELEEQTSKKMNLLNYMMSREMIAIYNIFGESKDMLALVRMNEMVEKQSDQWGVRYKKLTDETVAEAISLLIMFNEVKKTYDHFINKEYPVILAQFDTPTLYDEGELFKTGIYVENFLWLEEAKQKMFFKPYGYRNSTEEIEQDLFNYTLSSAIVVTDSLNDLLSNLKYVETTKISTFFVLDRPEVYSYFVFVVQYKNYVWLVNDAPDHDNPQTKSNSRNPGRKVGDKFDTLALPYRIMGDVKTWRTEGGVAKQGTKEMYVKSIKDYFHTIEKFYLQNIITTFLEQIYREKPTKLLVTVNDFLANNLLIGEASLTLDVVEDSEFLGWDAPHRERFDEIVSGYPIEQGLIRTDAKQFSTDIANWMETPERFAMLSKWSAYNKQREFIETSMDKVYDEEKGDVWQRMLTHTKGKERAIQVLNKLTLADEILFDMSKVPGSGKTEPDYFDLLKKFERTHTFTSFGFSGYYTDATCQICDTRKQSMELGFRLPHYQAWMWLFDLTDRADVPDLMRSYSINNPAEYNHMLSNVHPLAQVKDNLSYEKRYGLTMNLYCCKTCYNKARKTNNPRPSIIIN